MARINAKGCVLVSNAAAFALESLSKTLLVDLCVELLRSSNSSDVDEIDLLRMLDESYLPTVCRKRGEKPPKLVGKFNKFVRASASYTQRKPCERCHDTGRMHDRNNDEYVDATTDCTHCDANSMSCTGCTNKECSCHRPTT